MDVLTDDEINTITGKSKLAAKYNKAMDSESAYEILTAKLQEAAEKNKELAEETSTAKPKKSRIRL